MSVILKVHCPFFQTKSVVPSAWDGCFVTCRECRETFVAGLPYPAVGARTIELGVPRIDNVHGQELKQKLRNAL